VPDAQEIGEGMGPGKRTIKGKENSKDANYF
jgi:hypothetical protein